MKGFSSVLYIGEGVMSHLELSFFFWRYVWWLFKNLLLCGFGRVLIAFHGKTVAPITMKPFFYSIQTSGC